MTAKIVPDRIVELWLTFVRCGEDSFESMINAVICNMAIPISSDANVVEIYDYIANHCKETGEIPFAHDWALWDGCLCMDGKVVKRVGSKDVRPNTDAFWNYMERKIGYCNAD